MSVLILESWDGYGGNSAASSAGTGWAAGGVCTNTHAKTGSFALGGTGASGVAISRGFGNLTTNLTFSFGIWIYWTGTIPAQNGIVFGFPLATPYSGLNAQCGVTANASHQLKMERSFNGGTVLQTSAACLNTNDWNYITGTIKVDNSGTWDIYCNGIQVLNGSGDTQAQATAQVGGIHLGTGTTYWADAIWCLQHTGSFNNAHPGIANRQIVSAFFPTGAGATTGLTPLSGTNWQNVDEAPPNGDTDYNSGSSNAIDCYAADWTPLANAGIYCVHPMAYNRAVTGTQANQLLLHIGSTDYLGASNNMTTAYAYAAPTYYDSDPSTSAAWTYAGLSGVQPGYKAVGAGGLRLSQLFTEVLSTEFALATRVQYLNQL